MTCPRIRRLDASFNVLLHVSVVRSPADRDLVIDSCRPAGSVFISQLRPTGAIVGSRAAQAGACTN